MSLLLAMIMGGCAGPGLRVPGPLDALGQAPPPPSFREPDGAGDAAPERRGSPGEPVARAAAYYVGKERLSYGGALYRWDCSGLIEAAYARAGLPITGSSASLYERAQALGVLHRDHRPAPGDVAFFENTYDRNGNGRLDDDITHVAVVTAVDEDGTITMVHKGGSGVGWLYMNLDRPGIYQSEDGRVLNSYLRSRSSRDPRGTRYLSGELWRGFASFWEEPPPGS